MKKTNENGITLIALVVTIVVLLILAGITITYVLADGGVFKTARDAADAQVAGQIQDYASNIQGDVMTQCTVKNAVGANALTFDPDCSDGVSYAEAQKYFPTTLYTVMKSATEAVDTDTDQALPVAEKATQITDGSKLYVKAISSGKVFEVTYTNGTATVVVTK